MDTLPPHGYGYDSMVLEDVVVRAANRNDFKRELMERCGTPKELLQAPREQPRPSSEQVAAFLNEFVNNDAEASLMGKGKRASIDEIASMLKNYVEEECTPMDIDKRPSVDVVSKVLRGMIASHRGSVSAHPGQADLDSLFPSMRISYEYATPPDLSTDIRFSSSVSSDSPFGSSQSYSPAGAGYWPCPQPASLGVPVGVSLGVPVLEVTAPPEDQPGPNWNAVPAARARLEPTALTPTAPAAAADQDKLHYCRECGRGFRNPSNLTRHHRVHTGEKPYQCAHCGLAFRNSSNRRKHERACQDGPPAAGE